MDKNVRQINFDIGTNESRKYKVEAIWNSAVYTRELELGHLARLHYIVLWKSCLKEKNTWEPYSAIQNFKKLINLFDKNHPDKLTVTFEAIDTTLPMAKPTIRPITKSKK